MSVKKACMVCGTEFHRHARVGWETWARRRFCSNHCAYDFRRFSPELMEASAQERFWAKVSMSGECWIWNGSMDRSGYGRFRGPNRRPVLAHRFAYESLRGEIPDELHIDHLCRVRACVNPEHLEPVTQTVNNNRMRRV